MCPNDLFWSQKADVRTCIIILQKGKQFQNKVKVSNRPKNTKDLIRILETKDFLELEVEEIVLSKKKTSNQFIIDIDKNILSLFKYP